MKKFTLFVFSTFISLFSFSQTHPGIVGIWQVEKFDLDVKTNYPLMTKEIAERFYKDIHDSNGQSIFIKFTADGYASENEKSPKKYIIKGDSICVGDLHGTFVIEDDRLIIIDYMTNILIEESKDMHPNALKRLRIPHSDSIHIEKVVAELQLRRLSTLAIGTQNESITKKDFISVTQTPTFRGGEQAIREFIVDNLCYPQPELKRGIQGTVITRFVVKEDGKLSEFEVVQGVTPAIDKEAIRLIKLMPDWIPGRKDGVFIPVSYTLPIVFEVPPREKRSKKVLPQKK